MYSRHVRLRICCKKSKGRGIFMPLGSVHCRTSIWPRQSQTCFGWAVLQTSWGVLNRCFLKSAWSSLVTWNVFPPTFAAPPTMYYLYLSHVNSCVLRYQHLLVLYGHPSALDALMLLQRCLNRACPIRQGQTPSSIPSVKHLGLSTTVENLRHCRRFRTDFIDFIQQQQEREKTW